MKLYVCKHSIPRIAEIASRSLTSISRLVETSVHVQGENKVYELPILVKTVSDVNRLDNILKEPTLKANSTTKMSNHEEANIFSRLRRCKDTASIIALLQPIPVTNITPIVAEQTIK